MFFLEAAVGIIQSCFPTNLIKRRKCVFCVSSRSQLAMKRVFAFHQELSCPRPSFGTFWFSLGPFFVMAALRRGLA